MNGRAGLPDDHGAQLLFLFLVGAVVLAAGLGLRDPWPPDEPRFALIAKDMAESGNWLIPRVGGVLYPDKPPLFFWLVATFYMLTGSIAVAVLLPSFLAGMGTLWLVYDLARRLWNPRIAIWTGATLLGTLQFPLQMKAGQIDGLLCFWTTLGLYGLCRHLLLGPDWRWYAIAGASSGLGVITKGVGFLPLLMLIPWLFACLREWPVRKIDWSYGRWLLAPSAFVVAISVWLIPMLIVTTGSADPDLVQYRDNILLKQTVTRYADSWGHLQPPWYLFTNAIPWLWLPLSFLLPWLIPAWTKDLKARDPTTLLLGGWILLVLLFFSISDGKRSLYIFPALPALVMIAGHHLPQLLDRAGPRRLLFVLALTLPSLPIAAGLYALKTPAVLQQRLADPELARSLPWMVIGIGMIGAALALLFRPRRAASGFAAMTVTMWLGASLLVYPRIDSTRSGRAIVDAAEKALAPGESLGFAGWKEQLLLQWNQSAVHFGYRRHDNEGESRDAAAWLSQNPDHRLLLPSAMIHPCFDGSKLIQLGFAHRRDWFLAAATSVLPDCRANPETVAGIVVSYEP